MAGTELGPFDGPNIVDKNGVKSAVSKVLLDSAGKNGTENDYEEEDETMLTLTPNQIKEAFGGKERDLQSVKLFVRSYNLSPMKDERKLFLQQLLSKTNQSQNYNMDTNMLLNDTLVSCFGSSDMPSKEPTLPACIDGAHTNSYYLTEQGKISVARILRCFAYNSPEVQYCPVLYPIAAVIRHYLSESDTYNLITNLTSSKNPKYFTQTKRHFEISWRTALYLSRKMLEKHIKFLEVESSYEEMEGLFRQWIWWIFDWLSFPHVVRILDSYLLEGEKVLYRVCFALLSYFVKHVKAKDSTWKGTIKQRGLQGAFIHFCKEIPVTPNTLLNKGFRYRNFSKSTIEKEHAIIGADLKAKADGEVYLADVSSITSDRYNRTVVSEVRSDIPDASLLQALSKILSYKQLVTIWKWIPERITQSGTPSLAYSSDNDGFSLTTFYSKSEIYEPTVLVIKTVKGDVFGAYCSTSWRERNIKDDKGARQVYFGTGETFLFSFSNMESENSLKANGRSGDDNGLENGTRYTWVFADNNKGAEDLSPAERHARELFLCAQHDMISIGGGEGNAIYIDSTLSHGKTEKCQTFNNPPLCKESNFQIAAIEVFGLLKLDESLFNSWKK